MNTKIKVNGNKNITHDKIKAKLGLTNKKNHSVFYLEGGVFITPTNECDNFPELMSEIEFSCKRQIKNKLLNNDFLTPNFLMNFEICSERMKKNKNSYLSFQYHFKQKEDNKKNIISLKDDYEHFFIDLLNDIKNQLEINNITLSKNRDK